VGKGLAVCAAFIITLMAALARSLNRRRRQAEGLARAVTMAREEERSRIVRALHDDVSQPLYRILMGLQGCRHRVSDESIDGEMARLENLTRQIEATIRSELRKLHGSVVEEIGLHLAVMGLIETARQETDISIRLDFDPTIDLKSDAGSAVYRAVQESLFNIRRHADATEVSIEIRSHDDRILADISDDGVGWNGNEGSAWSPPARSSPRSTANSASGCVVPVAQKCGSAFLSRRTRHENCYRRRSPRRAGGGQMDARV